MYGGIFELFGAFFIKIVAAQKDDIGILDAGEYDIALYERKTRVRIFAERFREYAQRQSARFGKRFGVLLFKRVCLYKYTAFGYLSLLDICMAKSRTQGALI
jgi:hypothetical protein